MINRLKAVLAVLLLPALLPTPALAWNETPHMVIAQIAYSRLTPAAAEKVIAAARRISGEEMEYNEITIAIYMDDLRSDPFYDYLRPLHFIMKSIKDGGRAPEGENVLTQLDKISASLREGRSDAAEEARLIAYLIHLIGDAHQPLHCAEGHTKSAPDGDAGGNLFFIKGETRSLHSYWDYAGGLFGFEGIRRPLGEAGYQKIRAFAYELVREYSAGKDEWIKKMEPRDWVEESYQMAKDDAYDDIDENERPSPRYAKRVKDKSGERIAAAGYRLAALLNSIYADRNAPSGAQPPPQKRQQQPARRRRGAARATPETRP